MLNKSKSTWKSEVKEKINKSFLAQAKEEKQKKNMRFLKSQGAGTYLNHVHNNQANMALRIRLNMISWVEDNVGVKGTCPLCNEEDSTEHVFCCEAVENKQNVTVRDLERGEMMKEIVELFEETEERRREHWLENIAVEFDVLRREGTLWN